MKRNYWSLLVLLTFKNHDNLFIYSFIYFINVKAKIKYDSGVRSKDYPLFNYSPYFV